MPMLDIAQRHAEVFRLRMGERVPVPGKTNRDGTPKMRPEKLTDALRVTSPNRSVVEAFAAVYGGEVTPWEQEWQAYLPITALPVLVLPGQTISQYWESWKGSVCDRRCDGRTELLSGQPCACPADIATRMAAEGACRPTTRITVACPEVAVVGAGSLVSHGLIAAETLPQSVAIAEAALSRGLMIPAVLRIVEHTGKRHYVVPQLEIVGVSLATLESGEAPTGAIGAGGQVAPAPVARAAIAEARSTIAAAPTPTAAPPPRRLPAQPDEALNAEQVSELRQEIGSLKAGEQKMLFALARQHEIPNVGSAHFTLAHRERLGELMRQARVLAACQSVGVTSDDGRHELIREATKGEATSSDGLSPEQTEAVLAYCAELAASEREGA